MITLTLHRHLLLITGLHKLVTAPVALKRCWQIIFVSQSGGWIYDAYASAGGPPQTNYYRDSDGPTQADSATISINWVQQINPDNDVLTNETAIDIYSNDIAHPDTPAVTKGTLTEFSAADGGLKFASSNNKVIFTYANADSYTKKKPSFILTNYTASTAPVLKVNGSFLDSEDGAAHTSDTYLWTYNSFVDDANNIAYIQYLGASLATCKCKWEML